MRLVLAMLEVIASKPKSMLATAISRDWRRSLRPLQPLPIAAPAQNASTPAIASTVMGDCDVWMRIVSPIAYISRSWLSPTFTFPIAIVASYGVSVLGLYELHDRERCFT